MQAASLCCFLCNASSLHFVAKRGHYSNKLRYFATSIGVSLPYLSLDARSLVTMLQLE